MDKARILNIRRCAIGIEGTGIGSCKSMLIVKYENICTPLSGYIGSMKQSFSYLKYKLSSNYIFCTIYAIEHCKCMFYMITVFPGN